MTFCGFDKWLLNSILFILSLGFSIHTYASFDFYLGLNMGSAMMHETSGGSPYTNQSTFLIGHWGYSLGLRPQVKIGQLGLGVVGDFSWISESMDRRLNGTGSATTYRNEFYRTLVGPSALLYAGNFAFVFEYYPLVQSIVKYSDEKSLNPYRKDNKLTATGFGLGFNFGFTNEYCYQLIYKKLTTNKATMNGVSVTLPNNQYERPNVDEVNIAIVLKY
jgi:hypothetical protein